MSIGKCQYHRGDTDVKMVENTLQVESHFELPAGHIGFVSSFSGPLVERRTADSYEPNGGKTSTDKFKAPREFVRKQGVEAVLVIFRDEGPSDVPPAFYVPDRVIPIHGSYESAGTDSRSHGANLIPSSGEHYPVSMTTTRRMVRNHHTETLRFKHVILCRPPSNIRARGR